MSNNEQLPIIAERVLQSLNKLNILKEETNRASEEAKRKVLESTGNGYWKDKSGKTVDKTSEDGSKLEPVNQPKAQVKKPAPQQQPNINKKDTPKQKPNYRSVEAKTFDVNGVKLLINTTSSNYVNRIKTLLKNNTLQRNVETFKNLLDSLDSLSPEQITPHVTNMKELGFKVSYFIKGNDTVQIRFGNVPVFKYSKAKSEEDINQLTDMLKKTGMGFTNIPIPDSPAYKPNFVFKSKKAKPYFKDNTNVPEYMRKTTYFGLGKGESARNAISEQVQEYVISSADSFDKEEIRGLKEYSLKITEPNIKEADLEIAFQKLMSSSKNRSNEIQKNFGEIHAAVMLSVRHKDATILLPDDGSNPLSDLTLVYNDHTENIFVEEVAVKKKSGGVPSSAPALLNSFALSENASEETKTFLEIIGITTDLKKANELKRDDTSKLANQIKEKCIPLLLNNKEILNSAEFQKELSDERNTAIRFSSNLKDLSAFDFVNLLSKSYVLGNHIFEKHVKNDINWEKTSKEVKLAQVDADGRVYEHDIKPDNLKYNPGKRRNTNCTLIIDKV